MINRIKGKSSGKLSKNKSESKISFEQVYQAAEEPDHNHPYLIEKCIEPIDIRQLNNKLVIPIKRNKKVCGLQYISREGVKTFLKGSKIEGGYFLLTAEKKGVDTVITKDYETCVTIWMFLKCNVLVVFDTNNFLNIASLVRSRLPRGKIIIAADNDQKSEKNTEVGKAVAVAKKINGMVSIAPGVQGKNLNWNDYYKKNGLAKSKKKFNENMLNHQEVMMTALPKYEACYTTTDGIGLVRASDLQMRSIKWLWKGWLAAGKLHLIAGVAGTGKTTIALSLAAAITRDNAVLPDGSLTGSAAGSVLIWSGEDDIEDSLLPRLTASGADLTKVYFAGGRGNHHNDDVREFYPDQDIQGLQDTLQSIPDIKLIILDPVVAVIRGDSHKNTEVRKSLQPVVDMAAQLGAAVLGITHLSKGTMGRNPTERVTGSLAFGAVARLVLITSQPQKSGVLSRLVRAKSNVGESGGAIEYSIESKQVTADGVEGQFIEWADCLSGTADELLNVTDFTQSNNHVEEEWLKEALSYVAVSNNDLKKRAKKDGIPWRGVERAKHKLGAVKKRDGYGAGSKVKWSLPTKLENEASGEQEE